MNHVVDSPIAERESGPRRSFLVRITAVVIGGIATLFPFAASCGVFFDPLLRHKGRQPGGADLAGDIGAHHLKFARIGPLDLLPADGLPHQFALTADVADAWTHIPAEHVGTAYLTRIDSVKGPLITAFSSICPHLGCAVDFDAGSNRYECPCHDSAFAKDGQKLFGPALRGLDPLEVRLVDNNGQQEIWVAIERFRTGVAERVPIG